MLKVVLISFVILVGSYTASAQTEADRRLPDGSLSDRCSWFFDGDWGDCCIAHDKDYYAGGTKAMRKASDRRLRQCIEGKGHKYISKMMYLGVRIGGVGFLKLPFSWGFGKGRKPKAEPHIPVK